MMIKRMKALILGLALLAALLLLTACGTARGTSFSFSFLTDEPANSHDSKAMTIQSDMAKLSLQADLMMDAGMVAVTVRDVSTDNAVWEQSFEQGEKFTIELLDVKKDAVYLLEVQATQSKQVKLVVTTSAKLVESPTAPPVSEATHPVNKAAGV